jgi:hypothetical protein
MLALQAATCRAATWRLSRPQRSARAWEPLEASPLAIRDDLSNCFSTKLLGLVSALTPRKVRHAAPICGSGVGGGSQPTARQGG